ncbi:MAG: metal ABC transporter substrate-binding protein [Fimbriimonadales bacterium]|nr:metal ABC transporter substrate-binding protein [Fimbriimonadales bacterium]
MHQRALLASVLFLSLLGCGSRSGGKADAEVVASIAPLETLARELLPSGVEVRSLVSSGASPHAFELPPSRAALLERASLVLRVGPGFDDFAAAPGRQWDYLTEIGGVGTANGHFWTDPEAVLRVLPSLSTALREALPREKAAISRREQALASAIRERLPRWRQRMAPIRGRSVVLFHDALQPFCERFGIEVAGMVEPKPGVEPSMAELVNLAQEAKRLKPKIVVSEPQLPEASARAMARELGVPVVQIDPYGGRGPAGYLAFVDGLVERFAEALR